MDHPIRNVCVVIAFYFALLTTGYFLFDPSRTNAVVGISSNIKTDACITGFFRASPNHCVKYTGAAISSTVDATCRSLSVGVASATAIDILVDMRAMSKNTAGQTVSSGFTIRNIAGCTGGSDEYATQLGAYEFTAVTPPTVLSIALIPATVKTTVAPGVIHFWNLPSSSTGAIGNVSIVGYYD